MKRVDHLIMYLPPKHKSLHHRLCDPEAASFSIPHHESDPQTRCLCEQKLRISRMNVKRARLEVLNPDKLRLNACHRKGRIVPDEQESDIRWRCWNRSGGRLLWESRAVLDYAVLLWIVFHCVIVFIEEPHLRRIYGKEFEEILAHTPHWIGWRSMEKTNLSV